MKLTFHVHFRTRSGEKLQILIKESGYEDKIHPMEYISNGAWTAVADHYAKSIHYLYQLTDEAGKVLDQEYTPHVLQFPHTIKEFQIYDVWNLENFPEHYLNNKILQNKTPNFKAEKVNLLKKHTHLFRLEAPLYNPNWKIVMLGNAEALGKWEYLKTVVMHQTSLGVWEAALVIADVEFIEYKYGILDTLSGEVFDIESGGNRFALTNNDPNVLSIKADHYFKFKSFEMYHAAGVAVPVFALRNPEGFGVGEFRDLKTLADWSQKAGLSIIQILPINDTTANYTWTDSYPYAAVSVYALHPQYLAIDALNFPVPKKHREEFNTKRDVLNALHLIDYEEMIAAKWHFIKAIFNENETKILADKAFKKFINDHEEWLLPYAAFCVQRDLYKTPDFTLWKTHKKYIAGKIQTFFDPKNKNYKNCMLHAWVQFQLHVQLKDAVNYCHTLGISLKGDLPIGIYRFSVEAWKEPELFGMNFQAGAPPDQFTTLGQNWEFPTYNWEAMKKDGYLWWKNRFTALEQYFDALRIDHILGFFRIWRMPLSATQGILGYFYPALPITLEELQQRGIQFSFERFCTPFINGQILWEFFGDEKDIILKQYLEKSGENLYRFKEEWNTQRKLKDFFSCKPENLPEEKLLALCANVLLLPEEKDGTQVYHPRFNLNKTSSYQYLKDHEKSVLDHLYSDYFFKRQDEMWSKNAMEKLPVILNSTKMLICGEDLGLVPDCVPKVMDRLGITALKVQRMPSGNVSFYNPKDASYLNVVTASSHDTSTLRQWWKEDRSLTQHYFYHQLNQWGSAPAELEPALAEIIMKQHLYNDAMLSIFPIQEFFALDDELKSDNAEDERINNPAVFPHYWRYRMHINLKTLKDSEKFNAKIAAWVKDSKRI